MNVLKNYLNFLNEDFNYTNLTKNFWNDIVGKTKNKVKIFFDLENNTEIDNIRDITIEQDYWTHTKCKFKCQLMQAGGDWEIPIYYFRCQIISGYAYKERSFYNKSFFIFIPNKNQGNYTLIKDKEKYRALNNEETENDKIENNKFECWKSLKQYLKQLVELEIELKKKE